MGKAFGRTRLHILFIGTRQVLAITLAGCLAAGQSGKAVITPSGSTATTVTTSGNVTKITTSTVVGANAYNAFNTFNQQQGSTVDLFLPTGTTNLLNLVNGSTATIDGTLNSILNGKIGGNIFFVDPFGVFIGKNGVVNVGGFFALTPTASFQSQFFASSGNPSAAGTAAILNGTVPLTSDGLISVQGRINAIQNISLSGGSVNNSGGITSGAVFAGIKPDFSDVVNVAGLQSGAALTVENGNIVIRAANSFENSGAIATGGAPGLNAGNISIQAGSNINLNANSLISAAGAGANSNGGAIQLRAGQNAEIDSNALVTAAGGSSGNGGTVDLSATGTVNYDGGQLKAGAANGTAGTVTIDPTNLVISANVTPNDGSSYILSADSITVSPGVIIATRQIGSGTNFLTSASTGNSGSISLTASSTSETPTITIGDGAELLSQATNGFTAGDITLQASRTNTGTTATAGAIVNVGNAVLEGRNVTLSATSTATANSSTSSALAGILNDTALGIAIKGPVSLYSSKATTGITIGNTADAGTATINASGNVSITSTATSSTTSSLTGISGFAYGDADAAATATVAKNATVTAGGSFSLNAASNDTLSVKETTNQQASSVAAVAYGKANSTSTAEVDGSVTSAGAAQITAANTNSFSTQASASDFQTQTGSGGGAGIALGFYNSNAATNVTGSVTSSGGNVQIGATSDNSQNAVFSSSSVPSQGIKSQLSAAQGWVQSLGGLLSLSAISGLGNAPAAKSQAGSTQLGLAASVSVSETNNTATTTISGGVSSQAGTVITSTATDDPQIGAAGSVSGQQQDLGGAFALSNFTNTSDTYVDGAAKVASGGALSINANATIVNPAVATNSFSLEGIPVTGQVTNSSGTGWGDALYSDIKGLVTGLEGVAKPFLDTTSFVNTGLSTAGQSTGGVGIAGAVNLMGLTNQSTASVTGTASVQAASGDLDVDASSTATTLNAAGLGLGVGQLASVNPGVKAGTSLGGSYNGVNFTNASSAFVGDGTTAAATSGNINVSANTQTLSVGVGQSGDNSTQFGITGTFDNLNLTDSAEAYIQSNATVSASQNVGVAAGNTLTDIAVGGALGVGGSAQVGVAVNWNQLNDTTLAYIGDPKNARNTICAGCGVTAGQNVTAGATSAENIYAVTFAGAKSGNSPTPPTTTTTAPSTSTPGGPSQAQNNAGGGTYGFGVSGEIAMNQVGSSSSSPGIVTNAFINNGAKVTASSGSVQLNAQDTSFALAVGLAGTVGQQSALAGAYGQNTIAREVEAYTANTTVAGAGLDLNANSNGSLVAVTAGGAVSTMSGIAIAGSVNNNSISNTVMANVGNGTNATSIGSGGVMLNATEGSNGDQIVSAAGGLSLSSGSGIGAAVDIGSYNNNVTASIGNAQVNTTGNVEITSDTNVFYLPIAVSLVGASSFGAAGSLADESINDITTSSVGGALKTTENMLVSSVDSSSAIIVSGGLGESGNLGASVGAIIPQIIRDTTASIANSANVEALGSATGDIRKDGQITVGMLLYADTTGGLSDYVAGAAVAGTLGIAGAVIVNPFFLGTPDSLKDTTSATIGNGAIVNGSNAGALTQSPYGGQSIYLIAQDNSGIQDVAGMLAVGADVGAGVGFEQAVPDWIVNASIGTGATVNAASTVSLYSALTNSVNSYVVAGSVGGTAAAAGAASVVNETSDVTATIGGTVVTPGSVGVAASRSTTLDPIAGNLAVSPSLGAGFGVSVADTTTNDTVDAAVTSGASVTALANTPVGGAYGNFSGAGLLIEALSNSTVSPIAAGGSGSGVVGAQGSAPVTNLTENTTAEIDSNAGVNKTNTGASANQLVQVSAQDTTQLSSIAGSLAVGGLSLAGAADLDTVTRTVTADINGATVNAADNVQVNSTTNGSIGSIAAAGAVGGLSASGSASILNDATNTIAEITGGAKVTANNSVQVEAARSTSLSAIDGSAVAAGFAAVNGAVAYVTQDDATSAMVGPNTSVTALGQGGGGLTVSSSAIENNSVLAAGGALTGAAGVSGSVAFGNYTENTAASIGNGATIDGSNSKAASTQSVTVSASDQTTLTNNVGSLSASLGIGVGGAVDTENIQKNTSATIGNGATVNAAGAVGVNASSSENITSNTGSVAAGLFASASGTDANYQTHPIIPDTTASIGSSSIKAGSLYLSANDGLNFTADSGIVSAGGLALGAATVLGESAGATTAQVSPLATLSTTGNITVDAAYIDNLNGNAYAGSGGIASGNAAYATLQDAGAVNADLEGAIPSAANVSVSAIGNRNANANSGGLNIGGLTAGATIADATINGSTSADAGGNIGQTTGQHVQALTVSADNTPTANSNATAISAGIGSGAYNTSNADVGGTDHAFILSGSNITLAGANGLSVAADSTDTSNSTVHGGNYGGVTIGGADSEASSTPIVEAGLNDNENINALATSLSADYASNGVSATSHMSNGSLVNIGAGQMSGAVSNDSPFVEAYIGSPASTSSTVNGGAIQVQTGSLTNASASFEGEDYAGVNVPGASTATANINDTNQIYIAPNVTLTGTSFTALANTNNLMPQVADVGTAYGIVSAGTNSATANGCINAPSACGYGSTPGGTSITFGAKSLINVGSGAVNITATSEDDANNVSATGTSGSIVAFNDNVANENILDSPTITLNGAAVNAGTATITSQVIGLIAGAQSDSITTAAASTSESDSTMSVTANPSVTLTGANISAPASLTIAAVVQGDTPTNPNAFASANTASASINGATGSITANATNNTTFLPVVSVNSASSLTTTQLTVNTYAPAPPNGDVTTNPYYSNNANAVNHTVTVVVVQWVQTTIDEVVGWIPFFGSIIDSVTEWVANYVEEFLNSTTANNANGVFNSSPAIHLNGTLNQPATMQASLTVNPSSSGPVLTSNGVSAANDGKGDIVVNNIVNSGTNFIDLNAINGTLDGSLNVNRGGASAISLTNNTNENLIVNNIQIVTNNGSTADLAVNASNYGSFTPTFTNSTTGGITIANNSGSNVILEGTINNSSGSVTVSDKSGSILGMGSDTIEANSVSLTAGQNVGTSTDPVNLMLVSDPNPAAPVLSAQAGKGVDINAGLVAYGVSSIPEVLANADISSVTAGGSVILNLASPLQYVVQPAGSYTVTPAFGTGYTIGSVIGNGNVYVTAAGGELVEAVNTGTVTSNTGLVSLTAEQGDVYVANVNAPSGNAAVNAFDTVIAYGGTGITGKTVNLTSQAAAIGNNWNPLLTNATGAVTAQAAQGIYLQDNAGTMDLASAKTLSGNVVVGDAYSLSLGTVDAVNGSVNLSSNGSILNAGTAVAVTGSSVTIDGGSGTVGTSASPILVSTAGQVNAAATGDIDLSSGGGTLNLGSIDSSGGNVNLTNNLNIMNAGAGTNITAKNINMTATGAIGTGAATAISTDATGQLTAQGFTVNVTQISGDLAINSVSSTGNVFLAANAGNVDLGSVTASLGSIIVDASNSILNTLGTCSTCINLTGYTTTFSATSGSIGSQAAPIQVNNKNVNTGLNGSDLLNGSANGDIYVNEMTGNLISKSLISNSGNIGINILSGNAKFGNIDGNGSVTITDTGNQMSINGIFGVSGSASPTSVSLGVSASGGTLTVGQLDASKSVTTQADNTTLTSVIASNTSTSTTLSGLEADGLVLNMTGGTGGIASVLNATITPCSACAANNPVIFNQYSTANGAVSTTGNWLEFGSAIVGANATFTNNYLKVQVANKNTSTPDAPWQLFVIGNQLQDNATSIETVTSSSINSNPYTWPFPSATVFSYLWTFFGATP